VNVRLSALAIFSSLLAACGSVPRQATTPSAPSTPIAVPPAPTSKPGPPVVQKRGGGYYQDDGPGDNAPPDLESIPDAVPVAEPLHRFANRPYAVLGRSYVPLTNAAGYRARGIASWYGKKFHGQKTSSGEIYDMYGMTAAHATLPIPSYVRVTNPANGRSVVVRVNDRGPFHADRLIDLSYTAAHKLGYIASGSTLVEIEALTASGVAPAPVDDDPLGRLAVAAAARTQLDGESATPTQRDASGIWLQIGAFGNRDNAESFLAHVQREVSAEVADKLNLRSDARLHRIQLGPYASDDAAQRAATLIEQQLGSAPVRVKP
jgi:rare lipoprotein A